MNAPVSLRFVLTVILFLGLVGASTTAVGQSGTRSTADGVYTRQQADAGRDLFALACQSCHAPFQHALEPFRNRWFGRALGELFGYMRREMPQTDPGTMSNDEYARLLAYLLRINGMRPGNTALAADSAALQTIRIDSVPTALTPSSR